MPFLNIPLKSIEAEMHTIFGVELVPWDDPADYPVPPGAPAPAVHLRDHRWALIANVTPQYHSSSLTRSPGVYNGVDVNVGMWISNTSTGQSWQIIRVDAKSPDSITVVVQDIFRYNTIRSSMGDGDGAPPKGRYVIYTLNEEGMPQIDPLPHNGVAISFTQNMQSRFEYINLQYDYPLFQAHNSFEVGDVIAVDATAHMFVKSNTVNKTVVGRVSSVSDIVPGWFTINPVQKVVDTLDDLPGHVGDVIYVSDTQPGDITTTPGGAQLYIKLRNSTQSKTTGTSIGPTAPGSVFQLNRVLITVPGTGSADDMVSAINAVSAVTGVTAQRQSTPSQVTTSPILISIVYYEIALSVTSPAVSAINGVPVTFDISSTTPGYDGYAQAAQMATSINDAQIPDITATSPTPQLLTLTNQTGGPITIANISPDDNGVYFAGVNSGSGLVTGTGPSTDSVLVLTAVDSRSIDITNISGNALDDFGLVSVENGIKAAGMYIQDGLRAATSTVLTSLNQLTAMSPLIGDSAYVINSDDGGGNNVGEWSVWLYDGAKWIRTATQDSVDTDAKSIEYTLLYDSTEIINIGKISTGRRVTLITVEVHDPFDGDTSLVIGYTTLTPGTPQTVIDGLMKSDLIDLTVAGTYTTTTDVLFGTDTPGGDVNITATYVSNNTTMGSSQIIVSYM